MQGPDPAGSNRYPGDRAFMSDDRVTVQIHAVRSVAGRPRGAAVGQTMYALAVHLPTSLDRVIQGPPSL